MGTKVWSACFIVLLPLLLVGTFLCHTAIIGLVPVLQDLSENLRFGFYEIFGFTHLKSDSMKITDNCDLALDECNSELSQCPAGNLPFSLMRVTTTDEAGAIQGAFDNSLESIKSVGEDMYFGVPSLATISLDLRVIQTALNSASWNNQLCAVSNAAYCTMRTSSEAITAGSDAALEAIDKMIENDLVETFNAYSHQLVFMHALPYLLWLSVILLAINMKSRAKCAFLLYILFWLISFLLSLIITGIGVGVKYAADAIELPPGVFNPDLQDGDNNLRGALDNTEAKYPEFWAHTFKPLEEPMDQFLTSFMIFTTFCLLLGLYGCCLCCCKPFSAESDKVHPAK